MVERRARQPAAMLLLGQVQQRQDGALLPFGRVAADDGLDGRPVRLAEGEGLDVGRHLAHRDRMQGRAAHRSISPKTMSSEPMIAGTSASWWPLPMKSSASRWT